ncbi:RDD family protein [Glutamicibacter sp. JL.03c]|uniref:RDD family protein n=1 Tax=Glutamicibacter sp. JL.03c TaxID=2984842 RepID=UPI0021F733BF|nr:RDD family protein [Glutamicibacter sp. JL.03c]UYQ77101.1 RDD family protein [Glutamicibacter sp. JL.03c]
MDVVAATLAKSRTLGMRPANARLRIWSYLIDYAVACAALLPAAIGFVVFRVSGTFSMVPAALSGISALLLLVYAVVLLSMNSRKGNSPGKSAMRLRAAQVGTFRAPGLARVLVAGLVFLLSHLVPVIGPALLLLSCLFDKEHHRSWLDKIAQTFVVDVRNGLDPTNSRALARAEYLLSRPERDVSEHLPSLGTAEDAELDEVVLPSRPRSTAGIIGAQNSDWHAAPENFGGVIRRAAFAFDDGSYIPVPESGLIGRAPQAQGSAGNELLIALKDPQRLLSKTHLAFGCDGASVWVMDLDSGNGTQITVASGAPYNISSRTRVNLNDGDIVHVGSRSFRIAFQETDQ